MKHRATDSGTGGGLISCIASVAGQDNSAFHQSNEDNMGEREGDESSSDSYVSQIYKDDSKEEEDNESLDMNI